MESATKPPNPALPYREDCWSEGATSALIDAWGERYVELNRGNLRQKQWQEVADAVNSRRTAARRPLRSDIQCKNRIDTLKKKYKAEKTRIANSGGSLTSPWPFFHRLDALIVSPNEAKPSPPPPPPPPLPYKKNLAISAKEPLALNRKYSAAAAAAAAAAAERKDVEAESSKSSAGEEEEEEAGDAEEDEEEGVRELARAITRFGEVYERVEREKQRQMVELERERMEFVKGIEFQRMQVFVDCQIQLEKAKRAKRAPSESYL